MKVSHQIRSRREAIGMSLQELAQKTSVTEQAVRHWESGRSYPGKAKARLVEQVLGFNIDWTEGIRGAGEQASATAMINPRDLDLLLTICKLPADMKGVMEQLANLHLRAIEGSRFHERETTRPIEAFRETTREQDTNETRRRKKTQPAAPRRGSSRAGS